VFSEAGLDLLEVLASPLDSEEGPNRITVVSFDDSHGSISWGTEAGVVSWGRNSWRLQGTSIVSIVHLPMSTVVVGSADGRFYMFRDGVRDFLEAFQPSLSPTMGGVIATRVPGSSVTFVAQGNNEILVWDFGALLLIDRIRVPRPPIHLAVIGETLFCALDNGLILTVTTNTHKIESEIDFHVGKRIVRIGEYGHGLYSALDDGEVFLWNREPEFVPHSVRPAGEPIVDFVAHREFPSAVVLTATTASLVSLTGNADVELVSKVPPVCCCVDSLRPMAAIARADGTVEVWRLPTN
jgi:hypothetical protein